MLNARVFSVFWRAVLRALPSMLGIVILTFCLLKLVPGDLVDVLTAESGAATEETVLRWRQIYGLDLSFIDQLWAYLGNLAQFSLGVSPRFGVPVVDLVMDRLPSTFLLMGLALGVALLVGVSLGVVMAVYAGRWPDKLLSVVAVLFYSVPGFWIGLMMILLFSLTLGWLPTGGLQTIASGYTGVDYLLDRARYMVMPCLSLALFYMAIYGRLMRASMLETLHQDFVRTAKAKGVPGRIVLWRHTVRNAILPVTTVAGAHLAGLMGGAVVVETVYSWPGLGRLAFDSMMSRDYNVLLGILLISSLVVTFANVLADVVHAWLDPRVEVK